MGVTMKKFIVVRKVVCTITEKYAVEADTLPAAIEKSYGLEPFEVDEDPHDLSEFDGSHEARNGEWPEP